MYTTTFLHACTVHVYHYVCVRAHVHWSFWPVDSRALHTRNDAVWGGVGVATWRMQASALLMSKKSVESAYLERIEDSISHHTYIERNTHRNIHTHTHTHTHTHIETH